MTIFLTIIITLAVWQLLCVLFAVFLGEGDNYTYFSTFIPSSFIIGIGRPISLLSKKIRLSKYNKTHKLYYLYEYDEKRNKYFMVTSVVIENDFAKQFNIKADKNTLTDKYIVVSADTPLNSLCFIKENKIDKTFSNKIFYRFPKAYIEKYMI